MVTRRASAPAGKNGIKGAGSAPADLTDFLAGAQADAERFFGDGPVQRWHPASSRASWAAGAAIAATAMAVLAWVWGVPAAPDRAPAVVVAADAPRPAMIPIAAPAANGPPAGLPARAAVDCGGDDACVPAPTPIVQPAAGHSAAASLAWPSDPDAWALDPQTIAAPFVQAPAVRQPLHNTPVIADEADPTAADESQPEGDEGGGQDE